MYDVKLVSNIIREREEGIKQLQKPTGFTGLRSSSGRVYSARVGAD